MSWPASCRWSFPSARSPRASWRRRSATRRARGVDDYGRIVAACRAGGIDIAAAMVEAGLAIALPDITVAYVGHEARAREQRPGIWAGAALLARNFGGASDPAAARAANVVRHPLGRLGTPEDVARSVPFVSSADAGGMTGTIMEIDGGAGVRRR